MNLMYSGIPEGRQAETCVRLKTFPWNNLWEKGTNYKKCKVVKQQVPRNMVEIKEMTRNYEGKRLGKVSLVPIFLGNPLNCIRKT